MNFNNNNNNNNDDDSWWSGDTLDHTESENGEISFHTSNVHGTPIVHGTTGEQWPWLVGSYESLRLFRIIECSGSYDEKGNKIPHGQEANKSPNFIYYDSPEDYEEHWRTEISQLRADEWHKNVKLWFPGGEFSVENFAKSGKDKWLAQKTLAQTLSKMPQNSKDKEEKARQIAISQSYINVHHPVFNKRRAEINAFQTAHPEYALGHMHGRGLTRDDVLDVLIPGSTAAIGKLTGKSTKIDASAAYIKT
jgi:hypothetical protein